MKRVRLGLALGAVALVAAVLTAPANAATSASQTQVVKFTNQASVQLNLATTTPFDFGNVDPLQTYSSAANANVATVFSNAPWHLSVKGTGNFSDGGANTIPDSRLQVKGASTITLSNANQTIATGAAATPQAGTPTNIQYLLTLQWGDPVSANPYSDTLTYTATTP